MLWIREDKVRMKVLIFVATPVGPCVRPSPRRLALLIGRLECSSWPFIMGVASSVWWRRGKVRLPRLWELLGHHVWKEEAGA